MKSRRRLRADLRAGRMGDRGGSAVVAPAASRDAYFATVGIRRRLLLALCLALVAAACGSSPPSASPGAASGGVAVSATPATPAGAAWRDPSRPIEERVAALLAEMTLDEKIGQMTPAREGLGRSRRRRGTLLGWRRPERRRRRPRRRTTPASWYAMVHAYQAGRARDAARHPDPLRRRRRPRPQQRVGATIFPHNVGLGAVGDPDLVERIGRATAVEMAATGIRWDFAPVVAVPQDVRWGRTYEGYGEDPPRSSASSARAFIRGLQGADLAADVGGRGNAEALRGRRRHDVGLVDHVRATASTRA